MALNPKTGYRKARIGDPLRRAIALRYGCPPGENSWAACHYCGRMALIEWPRRASDKKPGAQVWFRHEIDHVQPEFRGGATVLDNLVLACRPCNRKKGYQP